MMKFFKCQHELTKWTNIFVGSFVGHFFQHYWYINESLNYMWPSYFIQKVCWWINLVNTLLKHLTFLQRFEILGYIWIYAFTHNVSISRITSSGYVILCEISGWRCRVIFLSFLTNICSSHFQRKVTASSA